MKRYFLIIFLFILSSCMPKYEIKDFKKKVNYTSIRKIFHQGIDITTTDKNAKVYATADGIVIYNEPQYNKETGCGFGNQVIILHILANGGKYLTRYAHLKERSDIMVGTKVQEGQPIGIVGDTGGLGELHLHYELWEYNYKECL